MTDLSTPSAPDIEEPEDDEDLLLNKYNPEILPMETWNQINKVALSKGSDVEKVEVSICPICF